MRVRRGLPAVLAALLALLPRAGATARNEEGMAGVSPLARYVPPAAELGGWTSKDGPQAFERDDLFLYINGGAEIYHEYGFARVLVQDFWHEKSSISLEIFEMADPAAAYGMFSFKRGPKGESVAVGTEASLEGYYLNFWKGRFLVTLTGMDASEGTVRGILAAARGVDARLDGEARPPALTSALPEAGLVRPSVKYLEGPLGLRNVQPFFAADAFAFRDAVKADYADGHSLFILAYDSPSEAAGALERAESAFREGARYHGLDRTGSSLRVADEDGRTFLCAARGGALIIVSGAAPGADAALVDEAAARVPGREP